jgi:tRNA pseudouridine38-40 synthase
MRYKITIEYDGTGLAGWQRQKNKISVQEILEESIEKLTQEKVLTVASGRTDAGVHARGQVVHFDLQKEFDEHNIRHGLNFYLVEKPVAVIDSKIVAEDFHARFSSKKRYYRYIILNRPSPSKLDKYRAWFVPQYLDVPLMQQAAKHLEGHHDFSSFRSSECQANSPVKTLDEIKITREGDFIFFDISAKSFLHNMVRNLVGTLKAVGIKKLSPDAIPEILAAKNRSKAGETAPPQGLYFMKVDY